jgi:hypothetical protein
MISAGGHFTFGVTGSARPYLREGWSLIEADFTWTEGNRSTLSIPFDPQTGTLVVEIGVNPMVVPPVLRQQRLIVTINSVELADEIIAGACTLGLEMPESALRGRTMLDIVLDCPDAVSPTTLGENPDPRQLGFAVNDLLLLWTPPTPDFTPIERPPLPSNAVGGIKAAVRFCTALEPADLVSQFESLGHNCEFGLMQRAVGAEPLGLLRFAAVLPHHLLRGLDNAFEGIGERARLRVFTERLRAREEYLVRDDLFGIHFHTNTYVGEAEPDDVATKLATHLQFLRRKFQERLEDGGLFVLQHQAVRSVAQALPVLNLLRSYGPAALLYVVEDRSIAPGTVRQERTDLFRGHTNNLPPMYEADTINIEAWLSICANTYRLWRESGGGNPP